MPPPAPFLDVNAVVVIYFRHPALLRDLLFDEDDLLVDPRLRDCDAEDDLLEPFLEPRLRDRDVRFFGSPPFERLRVLRRGRSSSGSSSASSSSSSSADASG